MECTGQTRGARTLWHRSPAGQTVPVEKEGALRSSIFDSQSENTTGERPATVYRKIWRSYRGRAVRVRSTGTARFTQGLGESLLHPLAGLLQVVAVMFERSWTAGHLLARGRPGQRRICAAGGCRAGNPYRAGMCAERAGAVSDVRICEVENRTAKAALPCALSLWMGREAGVDVRADSDLVPIPNPDRHQRSGMAGPADAASGASVSTGEKLLFNARGS